MNAMDRSCLLVGFGVGVGVGSGSAGWLVGEGIVIGGEQCVC